ncbi:MAG TPA: tRNA uracil 4-sulfurtransferase ThiI [Rectinemataceae bacterium]|nr:tRNA uracil 4-sulfurtransferase ThiI [Rectinemataceae bacterium]
MDAFYLVKIGEILLKLGNRKEFEDRLRSQIKRRLEGIPHRIELFPGRYFVSVPEGFAERAEFILSRTPGVNGYARAHKVEKQVEPVLKAALEVAAEAVAAGKRSFKAESRRSDKSFPLGSFELSSEVGARVLEAFPQTRVDLHNPEFTINTEIRERAYVYGDPHPGPRGLPVGSGGKGLLLLSGGIDSPVAGYMMARRGLALEAVYFHAYPYTSQEAKQKVVDLGSVVASFTGGLRLWTLGFTDIQLKIKKEAREDLGTVMMRMGMMEASQLLAERIGANCLITGESLGQVASQTAENLRLTQSTTSFPVLRPLIGIDKEETIVMAKRIGSFATSILPYEDCCVIFSPKHPILRATLEREGEAYKKLGLREMLVEAVERAEALQIPFPLILP